ncbi:hypothetical protein REPUB_Repub03eG0063500 [Reevesia pubescens]
MHGETKGLSICIYQLGLICSDESRRCYCYRKQRASMEDDRRVFPLHCPTAFSFLSMFCTECMTRISADDGWIYPKRTKFATHGHGSKYKYSLPRGISSLSAGKAAIDGIFIYAKISVKLSNAT